MNKFLATADSIIEIKDVAEMHQDISRFGRWLEDLFPRLLDFVLQIAAAFVVIIIGLKLIGWLRKIIKRSLEKNHADTGLIQFLDSLVKYGLYILLALSILQKFGVETTSIVAAIGSVGVAIGLALQGSLANFAGGVMILLIKPFKVGDYIVQGDLEGTVCEIQLFYTALLTVDNQRVVIPNGHLADNSLVNVTAQTQRRLDIPVGISYNSDIKKAKEILLETAGEDPDVVKVDELCAKAPVAVVNELGESSVNLILRVWVPTERYWDVKFRLTETVKLSFDAKGIEIPFNQLDVHLSNS